MTKKLGLVIVLIITLNISSLVVSVTASWDLNGIPICTAMGNQWYPQLCSDGAGGAIMTWRDSRNGDWDIYAQRVDSKGFVRWAPNGIPICSADDHQIDPMVCSDGNGGAFFVWGDRRNGEHYQIYAQRVDANGDIQWSENGIIICDKRCVVNHQIVLSSDGYLIITWKDYRPGDSIYSQKIDLNGNIQWDANGVVICNETSTQWRPQICGDGEGGAIIMWDDERRYYYQNEDIYAQRISSSGEIQWDLNGVNISNSNGETLSGQIVSDKNGGAIITWVDDRSGNHDIYTQRINSEGTLLWNQSGITICNAIDTQGSAHIVEDSAGGAVISWEDCRTGSNWDIYAQRIDPHGTVKWQEDGILLYNADNDGDLYSTLYHEFYSDGKGTLFLVYLDYRNNVTSRDVYAQNFDLNGKIRWKNNGKAICNNAYDQGAPKAVITDHGDVIVAWLDNRNYDSDIYAFLTSLRITKGIDSYIIFHLLVITVLMILPLITKLRKYMNANTNYKEKER